MYRRMTVLFLIPLLVGMLSLAAVRSAFALTNPFVGIPVSGATAAGQQFTGTLDIRRFTTQNGQLVAQGVLTGTLTGVGTIRKQQVTIPVTNLSSPQTCEILHLELGPLDLNLLGLMVHLDKIVLDITAQAGPGNLLGNLLCAIAGLLDANAPTNLLADLLNVLLDVFDFLT